MTTITIDRAVVEQALDAIESDTMLFSAWTEKMIAARTALRAALAQQDEPMREPDDEVCDGLRGGLCIHQDPNQCDRQRDCPASQQAEPVTEDMRSAVRWAPSSAYWSQRLREFFGPDAREGIDALERRLAEAQQAEPDISRCPQCNGPADNGFDRSIPPSPYFCTKCMAEPVEPVAGVVLNEEGRAALVEHGREEWHCAVRNARRLYTTPPQRLPLTEREILEAVGWERASMYMKLAPNFPVDEAKQETLKNARAVEKASWEKNHG